MRLREAEYARYSSLEALLLIAAIALVASACAGASQSVQTSAGAGLSFAPGACQRFAPTNGNSHRTVFIDAGHGGPDPGTVGRTRSGAIVDEKTATLAVALKLERLLRAQGYTVVLARTRDSSVLRLMAGDLDRGVFSPAGEHRDLLARIDCANAAKAALLLSIHFNAFGDSTVGGAETYWDAARPFADANRAFAARVQQNVVASLAASGWQIPDRGIAVDASDNAPTLTARAAAYPYLLELGPAQAGWLDQPSAMPGALCEPLFLSDPTEATVAASVAGQSAIAQAFVRAIQAQFAASEAAQQP